MTGTNRLTNEVGWVLCALFGGALVWMLSGCTTHAAEVSVEVSAVAIHTENDFYEPLSPYGRWEVIGSYGRCWIPNRVDADWHPYSNGYWQRTDAGWYWETDEPWGWATYHYGRWDGSPQFGWYWVPQTQWAPAWVSWHSGGGYIGWAPLYPADVRVISPRAYVFVEERHFMEPIRRSTVVVDNTAIINNTVINKGPNVAVIEKVSGRKVQAVPARELRSKEEAKVVSKQRIAPTLNEKSVRVPVGSQTQKALPASEPRQVAKPAVTTAELQPPVTKKEVYQADEQDRAAKLATEQRAQQEKTREMDSKKAKPVPAAVGAKPEVKHETKPETKVESRPVTERPASTKEPTEQRAGKDDEKKD
jgi:Family of unknown function (DUF6600)